MSAMYPHCNQEVLHAPGTCQYCDMYPERQAMRSASKTPYTPAEANGWYGNVATPADPDGPEYPRPESGQLNIMGLRRLVIGTCVAIVVGCALLAIAVLAYRYGAQ